MNYELTDNEKQAMIEAEIESAKREIFENRINIAKWQAMEGDWSNQIANSEQAVRNLTAAIDALSEL
jgi:hypothetical protein